MVLACTLQLGAVHAGAVLVCRVLNRPQRFVGIQMAVEDPQGCVERLALYNFGAPLLARARH
jgi:hypothetical protein